MTRRPGELTEGEEAFLGIERPTPEQEAEAQRIADIRQNIRNTFLRGLLSSQDFREWLMEQLTALNTFGHSFGVSPTGFPDPNATWFKAGMKAAGELLYEQFDAVDPVLVSTMRREWASRTPSS